MTDIVLNIEEKLAYDEPINFKNFQKLRHVKERIEDIEDTIGGLSAGLGSPDFGFRSATGNGFAIVVGHTDARSGAYATAPINQQEYGWNKHLAELIVAECKRMDIESKVFFKDGIGMSGVYHQVAKWGARCVVELHFNTFNGTANGTETLFDNDMNTGSRSWAGILQKNMLDALGLNNRGFRERDAGDRGYRAAADLDIPSAVIEPFFGDNVYDAKIAHDNKLALASAIAGAAATQLLYA